MEIKKYRSVVTVKHWIHGSGWSNTEIIEDEIMDFPGGLDAVVPIAEWWEKPETPREDDDYQITAELFDPETDELIRTETVWESEI